MEDWTLLEQYRRERSEAAFTHVIDRHMAMVRGVCLRKLRDSSMADDATIVVFTILAKKAAGLRRTGSLCSWLFQTARFVAHDIPNREIRRRSREISMNELPEGKAVDNAETWNAVEPLLNDAIASLGDVDRKLILLRFFEEQEWEDISRAVGLSAQAAGISCR
jgi:RNA polymerase sigma factor (sigma-70 family)